MKKMMLCVALIAIISFTGLLPFDGTDVGKLYPVEVLIVTTTPGMITIETADGLYGTGDTVASAIENLKSTSSGIVFMDTANYLLLNNDNEELLDSLYAYVRPACQVFRFDGSGEWKGVAKYLESHSSSVTVLSYRQGKKNLPRLMLSGEGFKIDWS